MGRQVAGVEGVVEWVEDQLRCGRFRPGDLFPSEQALSERLRVSRPTVREAKAQLEGRGMLVRHRSRSRFVPSRGAALFGQWTAQMSQVPDRELARCMREVLELRRLVFPDVVALAIRRASDVRLAKLIEQMTEFQTRIALRMHRYELAAAHDSVLGRAAACTRNPVFHALAVGLAEAMRPLPVWEAMLEERSACLSALKEVIELTKQRKASAARQSLRQHFRWLDPRLCRWFRLVAT